MEDKEVLAAAGERFKVNSEVEARLGKLPGVQGHTTAFFPGTVRLVETTAAGSPFGAEVNKFGSALEQVLGRMVVNSDLVGALGTGKKADTLTLPSYGRAGFSILAQPLVAEDGTVFPVLYRKGFGAMRRDLGWGEEGETYGYNPGTFMEFVTGMAQGAKRDVDVQRSLDWHRRGMRVRLPVAGLEVVQVPTQKGLARTEDFLAAKGMTPERTEIGVWARRNPVMFGDMFLMFREEKLTDNDRKEFLMMQAVFLEHDADPGAKQVAETIRKTEGRDRGEWLKWLGETAAKQAAQAWKEGVVQTNLNPQNLSVAVEMGGLERKGDSDLTKAKDAPGEYADQTMFYLLMVMRAEGYMQLAENGRFDFKAMGEVRNNFFQHLGENLADGDRAEMRKALARRLTTPGPDEFFSELGQRTMGGFQDEKQEQQFERFFKSAVLLKTDVGKWLRGEISHRVGGQKTATGSAGYGVR